MLVASGGFETCGGCPARKRPFCSLPACGRLRGGPGWGLPYGIALSQKTPPCPPRRRSEGGEGKNDSALPWSACASLAETVGPLGERLDPIETLARGEVERALAGPRERDIGGLAARLDGAEILALGIEH